VSDPVTRKTPSTPRKEALEPLARAARPLAAFDRIRLAVERIAAAPALTTTAQPDADAALPRFPRKLWDKPPLYLLSFIFIVIIPALATILYLAFIASDQYVSEARFAVRTALIDSGADTGGKKDSDAGVGGIPALAGQDAYVVASYIRSPAIFAQLPSNLNPREIFRPPDADFWARVDKDPSIEQLTKYWRSMVTTYVDGPSGAVTVSVRAFRPQDAMALTQALIEASEKLVNSLSARSRADAMSRAEEEVRKTEADLRKAFADLRAYRDLQGLIDPQSAANSTGQLLLKTMSERIVVQNQYYVASRAMDADAPSVVTLKNQLAAYDDQIAKLKARITSNGKENRTLSAAIVGYEELELKRIFAEKFYTMAQDALERARIRAERQNIYVTVFMPPGLPEEAQFPERLSLSFLIPIGLLIFWGIGALMAAAIEDHTY
jgi:capsular polysaccharide transport system permease protein